MKRILIITILLAYNFIVSSQEFRTGSAELDMNLSIINTNAKSDFVGFRTQIRSEYNVSDSKFEYMSVKLGMRPADIYFALEIGKYSHKPIDDILVIYQKDKGRGWGEIAKKCGIKPGSAEFHSMKSNAGNKAEKSKGSKNKNQNDKKSDSKGNSKDNKGSGKGKSK